MPVRCDVCFIMASAEKRPLTGADEEVDEPERPHVYLSRYRWSKRRVRAVVILVVLVLSVAIFLLFRHSGAAFYVYYLRELWRTHAVPGVRAGRASVALPQAVGTR